MTGESRRQIEHIVPVGFAFLLRWLSLTQALALALLAVAYGAFGSRLLVSSGFREDEKAKGYSAGKISYALVILFLLLVFRHSFHVVAGAWGVLALGDAASNLAGRAWGKRKLPWSRDKSWIGTTFFFLSSWWACLGLVLWTASGTGVLLPPGITTAAVCALASAAGAMVESLPLPVNDNLTAPLAAAVVLGAFL